MTQILGDIESIKTLKLKKDSSSICVGDLIKWANDSKEGQETLTLLKKLNELAEENQFHL